MKPRHVAQRRMQRPVVGEAMDGVRALTARLHGRSAADSAWEAVRAPVGEGMVWDHRPVALSSFRMPEAGPNAPLLKRVVRHPYAMEPSRPERGQVFDASRPDRTPSTREPVRMVFRANRDARGLGIPLPLDHAPERRDPPFERARQRRDEEGR